MPNFEVFHRSGSRFATNTPEVTINRRGVLALNRAAHAALQLAESVELLFDRSARIVGLRPAGAAAEVPHTVTVTGRGVALVSASAFLRYYDVDTTAARRWPARISGEVLCLDLEGGSVEVTSNRASPT